MHGVAKTRVGMPAERGWLALTSYCPACNSRLPWRKLCTMQSEGYDDRLYSIFTSSSTTPGMQGARQAEATLLPAMLRPDRCLHFLRPGRLVRVREGPLEWGWGVVLALHRLEKTADGRGARIKVRARMGGNWGGGCFLGGFQLLLSPCKSNTVMHLECCKCLHLPKANGGCTDVRGASTITFMKVFLTGASSDALRS